MALVKLDRERTLSYSVMAARKFKQAYGSPLYLVRFVHDGQIGLLDHDCLCHVLWAGLQHEDRKLTVDRVAELLDQYIKAGNKLKVIYEAVAEAFEASGLFGMGEDDQGKAETPETSS